MSLRICLVTEEEEGWGGIGTYTFVLARALRNLDHIVHVIVRDWEADRCEHLDGIDIHRLTLPEPSWHRGTVRLTERLYSAREALLWSRRVAHGVHTVASEHGLDVVEVPEYRGTGAWLALWPGRVPLVVRLHTPAFLTEQANRHSGDALDRHAVELLERLAVCRAGLLTAPSAAVARAVDARWGVDGERLQIIPNPIDDQLFSPAGDGTTHRLSAVRGGGGAKVASTTVLCVARLERIKGVDVLLEALPTLLARHPDVRVCLVGEDDPHGHGGGSMAAHLCERARALAVPDHALQILGAVDRRQLPALLRQAAVCVVPSRWENLPYACIEAMACARPVIASRVGGLSEVITDGHNGLLVSPGDASGLADAVGRLLADRALAERLGIAARATVERHFGAAAVASKMAAAYVSIPAISSSRGNTRSLARCSRAISRAARLWRS